MRIHARGAKRAYQCTVLDTWHCCSQKHGIAWINAINLEMVLGITCVCYVKHSFMYFHAPVEQLASNTLLRQFGMKRDVFMILPKTCAQLHSHLLCSVGVCIFCIGVELQEQNPWIGVWSLQSLCADLGVLDSVTTLARILGAFDGSWYCLCHTLELAAAMKFRHALQWSILIAPWVGNCVWTFEE